MTLRLRLKTSSKQSLSYLSWVARAYLAPIRSDFRRHEARQCDRVLHRKGSLRRRVPHLSVGARFPRPGFDRGSGPPALRRLAKHRLHLCHERGQVSHEQAPSTRFRARTAAAALLRGGRGPSKLSSALRTAGPPGPENRVVAEARPRVRRPVWHAAPLRGHARAGHRPHRSRTHRFARALRGSVVLDHVLPWTTAGTHGESCRIWFG